MEKISVIPLSERSRNNVSVLEEKILAIQKSCEHDFRLLEPHDMKESKVPQVYEIQTDFLAPHAGVGQFHRKYTLRCMACNLVKKVSASDICLRCFKKINNETVEPYEKYFRGSTNTLVSNLHQCSSCDFSTVSRESSPK